MQNFTGNNKYYLVFFPSSHFSQIPFRFTGNYSNYCPWEILGKISVCFESILLHLATYFDNSMNFSFLFSLLIRSFRFYYLIYKTSNPANIYLFQFKKSFYF